LHLDNKPYFANYRHTLELFFLQHAGTTMKRLTVALIAALSSPLVLAVEKPYIGIDYQLGTYDTGKKEVNPEAFRLRGGTELNPYLAVEAQVGAGTQSDVYAANNVSFDIKVESFYSLFVRPQISISNFASVYGLVGGTYIDVSSSSNNPAIQPSDKGFEKSFSYGVGVDFNVSKNIRLNADYIQYMGDYSAISFGVKLPIN
jgi:opacity protein-like surface antigen